MAASDSIRVRLEPELKQSVTRMYSQRGTTVSAAVRSFLIDELSSYASALDEFDAIMSSADKKAESSGMPEPSIDDINDYITKVRAERASQSLAVS